MSRNRTYMGVSSVSSTRYDPQATDRNVCQAIWQTFTEAIGNKEQYYA